MHFENTLLVILSFILSFIIVFVSVPSIVNVAHMKHFHDEPGHRKSHRKNTPNLGGIAIFASLIIGVGLFVNIQVSKELMQLLAALVVIFFVGIKDDILVIAPVKKLYGEIIVSVIIVILGNMRFTNLHGFMGIHEINYASSVLLTCFVVIVLINSINLIDGIDGLASGIGILASITFGIWFFVTGYYNYAILSATMLGSLVAFFGFNVFGKENKIFMGDAGSLVIGLVVSTLVIKFNEANISYKGLYAIHATPAVSFGILIVPLFDTIRVFIIRIFRGHSPFYPDKNHLHHRLLMLGFSHLKSTILILAVNILFIVVVLVGQSLDIISLLLIIFLMAIFFTILTEFFVRRSNRNPFVPTHISLIKPKKTNLPLLFKVKSYRQYSQKRTKGLKKTNI